MPKSDAKDPDGSCISPSSSGPSNSNLNREPRPSRGTPSDEDDSILIHEDPRSREREPLVPPNAGRDPIRLDMSDAPFPPASEGRSGRLPLLHDDANDADFSPYNAHDDGAKESLDHDRRGRSSRGTSPLMGSRSHNTSFHSRRSTLRSHSPDAHAAATVRKKYTIAGIFLVLCLVAFVVQTELGAYVQQDLGWNKAYCMLYLTHGSWALLWPVQLLILRLQHRSTPWAVFWRHHVSILRSTAAMVQTQDLDWSRPSNGALPSAVAYIARTTAFVTAALTVAGLSWYVAVELTTPSDLTAIYNCSAFFAYVFSVPLLREPLRLDKSIAVMVAIVGVLIVAYGDRDPEPADGDASAAAEATATAGRRFLGNMIIGVGSVLYGLYEVLYKRFACPPEGCPPTRGVIFANTFGTCIGLFTLLVLWVPLPLLHWLGWETFELPTGETAWMLFLSVIANATFAGSFLVLISLTSPVLSSVASLLTIFIVALTDWLLTGKPLSFAALAGGALIMVAFLMLSWSTWREMNEHEANKPVDLVDDSGDESDREDRELM